MPSPPTLVRRPSSVKMSSRTTRAMEPLDTTASFRAMLLYTCRPSRSTDTSSIIRDSTVKRPWARSRSRSSSLTSSSDMKPRLPRFTPSTGTLCSATVRARCRMVPSPPKAISRSAWRISCCKGRHGQAQLLAVPLPLEGQANGGLHPQTFQHIPGLSTHFQFTVPVRIGTKYHAFWFHAAHLSPSIGCGTPPRSPAERSRRGFPARDEDSPDIRYSPPGPRMGE